MCFNMHTPSHTTQHFRLSSICQILPPGVPLAQPKCGTQNTHSILLIRDYLLNPPSSVVSAAANAPGASDALVRTLFGVEIFVTVAFGLEAALKIFVLGAWGHSDAYLHQPGLVLELLIATHSLVSLCMTGVKWLYFFRPLRALFAFTETRIVVRSACTL